MWGHHAGVNYPLAVVYIALSVRDIKQPLLCIIGLLHPHGALLSVRIKGETVRVSLPRTTYMGDILLYPLIKILVNLKS
jgi:hypothetical protein